MMNSESSSSNNTGEKCRVCQAPCPTTLQEYLEHREACKFTPLNREDGDEPDSPDSPDSLGVRDDAIEADADINYDPLIARETGERAEENSIASVIVNGATSEGTMTSQEECSAIVTAGPSISNREGPPSLPSQLDTSNSTDPQHPFSSLPSINPATQILVLKSTKSHAKSSPSPPDLRPPCVLDDMKPGSSADVRIDADINHDPDIAKETDKRVEENSIANVNVSRATSEGTLTSQEERSAIVTAGPRISNGEGPRSLPSQLDTSNSTDPQHLPNSFPSINHRPQIRPRKSPSQAISSPSPPDLGPPCVQVDKKPGSSAAARQQFRINQVTPNHLLLQSSDARTPAELELIDLWSDGDDYDSIDAVDADDTDGGRNTEFASDIHNHRTHDRSPNQGRELNAGTGRSIPVKIEEDKNGNSLNSQGRPGKGNTSAAPKNAIINPSQSNLKANAIGTGTEKNKNVKNGTSGFRGVLSARRGRGRLGLRQSLRSFANPPEVGSSKNRQSGSGSSASNNSGPEILSRSAPSVTLQTSSSSGQKPGPNKPLTVVSSSSENSETEPFRRSDSFSEEASSSSSEQTRTEDTMTLESVQNLTIGINYETPDLNAPSKFKIEGNKYEYICLVCGCRSIGYQWTGCSVCGEWYHGCCIGLQGNQYKTVKKKPWYCKRCIVRKWPDTHRQNFPHIFQ